MIKNLTIFVFVAVLAVFSSCGSDNKQTQSSLTNIEEDKKYAISLYGNEGQIIARGDLLGNSKQSAIAAIVVKQTDYSYWIKKGSFIQKENDGWKVLLKMEEKLTTPTGSLVEQVEAINGYIIKFDTAKKPVEINIVLADEYGKASSDEALIKWINTSDSFVFSLPIDENPQ